VATETISRLSAVNIASRSFLNAWRRVQGIANGPIEGIDSLVIADPAFLKSAVVAKNIGLCDARIAKGVMVLTREQRDSRTYTLYNSDAQPRQVVIEHPSREGWKLAEGAKPEETSASYLRFRVAVGPGKTEKLEN